MAIAYSNVATIIDAIYAQMKDKENPFKDTLAYKYNSTDYIGV